MLSPRVFLGVGWEIPHKWNLIQGSITHSSDFCPGFLLLLSLALHILGERTTLSRETLVHVSETEAGTTSL